MSLQRIIPYLFIFLACLVLGLAAGFYFKDSGEIPPTPTHILTPTPTSIAPTFPLSSNQLNVLVIGVDRINAQARLISVWMVILLHDDSEITFMPFYPTPAEHTSIDNARLLEAFQLDPTGKPDSEFLNLFGASYLMRGYIVLDEIAMIEMVDFLGGLEPGVSQQIGAVTIGDMPLPWVDPFAAYEAQNELLSALCEKAIQLSTTTEVGDLLSLIPKHVYSDLPVLEIVEELRGYANRQQPLRCNFPMW